MSGRDVDNIVTAEWTERLVREVCSHIERKRVQICEEISRYPAPIPACDAQFNYLLQARRDIARELARLKEIEADVQSEACIASLYRLIDQSPFLEDDVRRDLRAEIKRAG